MGREIRPAQLELSMAIAAGRINLWGRRPGSSQFEQIANDLFSLSKFKVVVTPHGDLSTEPPRKRHAFEEEYKDDCKWHDIKFDEDEIRREWLPAGCAEADPALSPSEPSATREPPAEDVEQQRLLRLPEEPQFEEPTRWRPDQVQTWFENVRKIHPRKPGENKSAYARRLHNDHMKKDFGGVIPWDVSTLRRRLND